MHIYFFGLKLHKKNEKFIRREIERRIYGGELLCSNGKIYDLGVIDNCIYKIMETLKKELSKGAHNYEIYNHCLIEVEKRLKTNMFSEL